MKFNAFLIAILALIVATSFKIDSRKNHSLNDSNFLLDSSVEIKKAESKMESSVIIDNDFYMAHASQMADLALSGRDNEIMLVYFAGSREGEEDVVISQSFIDKTTLSYTAPKTILNREMLSKFSNKFIRKVGNPLVFSDALGRVHLFVVGVSLGGWATSKIYQFEFLPDLEQLMFKGELHLGAFANLSHLVRNPPILLENGGFMLPIYYELANKYVLMAFFDENANLRFTKKVNELDLQLQPSVIALDSSSCLNFMRVSKNENDNIAFLQKCLDSGNTWEEPIKTNIKNFDSAGVLFKTKNGIYLINNDGFDLDKKELDSGLESLKDELVSAGLYEKIKNKEHEELLNKKENMFNFNVFSFIKKDTKKDTNIYSIPNRARLSLFKLEQDSNFKRINTIQIANEASYPSVVVSYPFVFISYSLNRHNIKVKRLNIENLDSGNIDSINGANK